MARRIGIKYPKGSVWKVKKNNWFVKDEEVTLGCDGYRLKKHGRKQFVEATNANGLTVNPFPAMYLRKRVR